MATGRAFENIGFPAFTWLTAIEQLKDASIRAKCAMSRHPAAGILRIAALQEKRKTRR